MFVIEVSRKTGACMILLIIDIFFFLCLLGVNFPKRFLQIGVPLLFVAEYIFSEWVGKKYWRNQKLADFLTKAFVVLLAMLFLLGVTCVGLAMREVG